MKKIAILVAVENFASPDIAAVTYARNDAQALSEALGLLGIDPAEQLLLIDGDATHAAITTGVKKALKRLKEDDGLYFFYFGRGFSAAGQNYLTCHDTHAPNWKKTCLSLESLFKQLKSGNAAGSALFLDCSQTDIVGGKKLPEFPSSFDDEALEEFIQATGIGGCFTACRSREESYRSNLLQHGVWAAHLAEAFTGTAPLALKKGKLVASSLQKYLAAEVPRTLRKTFTSHCEQSPLLFSASQDDMVLADLKPILQERKQAGQQSSPITEISFIARKTSDVRRLSGWKKSHRVPDNINGATESFIADIAESEVQGDLDAISSSLKSAFKFVRRDLTTSAPEEGAGTIITPHFNYSVSVSLNPEDTSEVVWTRIVDTIRSADQVASRAFGNVFDHVFDTLEFTLPQQVQIDDFIDAVEAADIPNLKIDYDRAATYCDLRIKGSKVAVKLTSRTLAIVHHEPKETRQLIQSLETVRSFVDSHGIPLISFASRKH